MKHASWKTTLCGILGIVIAAALLVKNALDGDPATTIDFGAFMQALSAAGIGGTAGMFFSRDDDKSSEDVGNK